MNKYMTRIKTETRNFLDKIDSEYGHEIALKLLSFKTIHEGFRNAGSKAENDAADWIADEMKTIGLSNVRKESFDVDSWVFYGASVQALNDEYNFEKMVAGSFAGLDGTSEEGITGDVIYVGEGTAACYEDLDVNGKIVFIDTDAYFTYWYNVIFEEAQARGASAIIAAVTDRGPGTYNDKLITIQNIQGFVDIPAVMLNKGDSEKLREALKTGKNLRVNIKINIKADKASEAHFVHGMIEGKNPNSYIIYSGHYDAYWDGYLDNASSLGSCMTIAKAIIDSGYKPNSNIVFLMNGAEEYGRAGSAYDYCVGSTAIVKKHPEWVENTKICFNFELTAHNQLDKTVITVNESYKDWFEEILSELEFVDDYTVIPTSMAGADNIVFLKAGMPTCMNITSMFNDEDSESVSNYDHTQHDNADRHEQKAFNDNNMLYGALGLIIDSTPHIKMNINPYVEHVLAGLNKEELRKIYANTDKLYEAVETFENTLKTFEEQYRKCEAPDWAANKIMLELNRLFNAEIYKYNAFSELIVGHMQPYTYIKVLDNLLRGIENNDFSGVEQLLNMDNNYLIPLFSKEVYEKTVVHAFQDGVPQEWAEGNVIEFPDLYDVLTAIIRKCSLVDETFDDEIRKLEEIKEHQVALLCDALDKEMNVIILAEQKANNGLQI